MKTDGPGAQPEGASGDASGDAKEASGGAQPLCAQAPAIVAACVILPGAIDNVQAAALGVLESSPPKPKPVYRLRTTCRRLESALGSFAPVAAQALAKGTARKLLAALKELRREAGAVRTCDVFEKKLLALTEADGAAGELARDSARLLIRQIKRSRKPAATFLHHSAQQLVPRVQRYSAQLLKELEAAQGQHANTLCDLAAQQLAKPFARMETAAEQDLSKPVELHDLRIRVKKLRYSCEVFEPCEGVEELRSSLVQVQRVLGRSNDAHELAEAASSYAAALKDAEHNKLAPLCAELDQRASLAHAEALSWWQATGDALLGAAVSGVPGLNSARKNTRRGGLHEPVCESKE